MLAGKATALASGLCVGRIREQYWGQGTVDILKASSIAPKIQGEVWGGISGLLDTFRIVL